jgi:hypothetical protein
VAVWCDVVVCRWRCGVMWWGGGIWQLSRERDSRSKMNEKWANFVIENNKLFISPFISHD